MAILLISALNLIALFVLIWLLNRFQGREHDKTRALLLNHQEWLFNQLYAIKPGAVLAPDEKTDEPQEDKPAVVIKIGDDGMDEFNGSRDDWH